MTPPAPPREHFYTHGENFALWHSTADALWRQHCETMGYTITRYVPADHAGLLTDADVMTLRRTLGAVMDAENGTPLRDTQRLNLPDLVALMQRLMDADRARAARAGGAE